MVAAAGAAAAAAAPPSAAAAVPGAGGKVSFADASRVKAELDAVVPELGEGRGGECCMTHRHGGLVYFRLED